MRGSSSRRWRSRDRSRSSAAKRGGAPPPLIEGRWSGPGNCGKRAPHEPRGDREVEQVPADAVHEGGAVRTRGIEDGAGDPAAERHAEERSHQDDRYSSTRFAWREVLAHDERISG